MSNVEQNPKVTLPQPEGDDASADSGDSMQQEAATPVPTGGAPNRYENLERLKREKRLAMNRECARSRRRRKKLRMDLLDTRVQDLQQKNSRMQEANGALRARVMQLEGELGVAKSTMGVYSSNNGASSFMRGAGLSATGLSSDAMSSHSLIAEKLGLQRRAALAGIGGSAGAGGGLGGLMGAGGSSDQATTLRYMQLMQAKSALGGGDQQSAASLLATPRNPLSAASFLRGATDAPTEFKY